MDTLANLQTLLPILLVMGTGMIVLIGTACLPFWKRSQTLSPLVTLVGIVVAAITAFQHLAAGPEVAFNGAVLSDGFAQSCNLILLIAAAIATLLAMTYLENRRLNLGEYYVLLLFSTSGAMLMAAANDLIVLFIGLETLSVALYVMAGFARTEERSEEAALKYFLLGAFAAGFLLYGIALIYGGSAQRDQPLGTTLLRTVSGGQGALFERLDALMRVSPTHAAGQPSVMLMTGIALLLVGLAFKAALIPFHMWTPDVYEGAPTSVTAYMAACAKIGAFAALLRVFSALAPISQYWLIGIQILAVVTMFGGNILAVTQENVKRMLAYSSIAHAGYLMVAVAAAANRSPAAQEQAYRAMSFYLLAYTLMTMGAFAVLIWLSKRGHDVQTLADMKGLARRDPVAAYTMLIFMLSLGGIPPTMGFMGKWFLFYAAWNSGQFGLAVFMALASIISVYYYLKIVWVMCFQEPDTDTMPGHAVAPLGVKLSLWITGLGSALLGIFSPLLSWLMNAAGGRP